MTDVKWENLRPDQIEARVEETPVVYLPFGSLEWHGYHNPLGLDTIKARALCIKAAKNEGGIVSPGTFWPIGGMPHPWTVRMSEDLIHELAVSIYEQMAHVGFDVVIAVTGHYGIDQVLHIKKSALEVMKRSGLTIYALPEYEVATDKGYRGDHAAKWETSLTMALFPDLVDMEKAEPPQEEMDGVMGEDPRKHANRELGRETADVISNRLAQTAKRLVEENSRKRSQFIEAFRKQTQIIENKNPEIFQNKNYLRGTEALWKGNYVEAIKAYDEIKDSE